MNQAEIEAKIVELALLYERQGEGSSATREMLADLAKENAQNVGKARMSLARKVMLKKVTVKQGKNDVAVDIKSATVSQVMKAIESARSGVAVTQTTKEDKDTIVKNKSNDLSMLGELLSNAEKEQKNQQQTSQAKPTPKKQKPVKKAKAAPATQVEKNDSQAKPAEVKNKIDDKKLESVMKAVDEYIYSRERKAKYAKEIVEAAEQKDVALNVLNHLRTEFTKRSGKDEPKVKRFNLFKLAVAVGAKSFTDEEVKSTLSDLLHDISERCQKDFIRFETQKEDFKDDFVVYLSSVRNENMKSFRHDIYLVHTSKLRGKLNEDFRPKYNEWLNNFSEEAEAKAKAEYEANSENGDKKDKTKTAEGNNPKPIQPKKGDTTMADENNFTPTEVQKEACKKAGIEDIGRFKDESSLIAALKEKGYEIKNNEVLPINSIDGNGENNEKAGKEGETGGKPKEGADKEGDTKGKEDETDDKDKSITVNTGPVKEKEPKTNEEAPAVADWIKEKIEYYDKMSRGEQEGCPKLENYHHDDTIKDGFAATFDNGGIHYTSKDNVTVSPESGLKIFEVLVTEPHNKGRPVNFGKNLEHKQAVLLFAACVLHGNKIGNGAPEISPADLDMIKDELAKQGREEDWNNFTAKIKEMTGDKSNENKDNKENKENKPKAFDEETKGKIKEALEDQYKLSALEDKGADKAVTTDKDGNPIESEYDKLKNKKIKVGDKEVSEKEFLAEKFKENPGEVRAIVKDLINEKTGRKEKEATIADRVEMVRLKSRAKGDDKNADGTKTEGKEAEDKFRANRLQKLQEDMKIALGIGTDEKKKEDDLKSYIEENHITTYTYIGLGGEDMEVAKLCYPSQKDMQAALGIVEISDTQKRYGLEKLTGDALQDYIKKNEITAFKYGLWGGKNKDVAGKCIVEKDGDTLKDFAAGQAKFEEVMSNVKEGGRSK